MHILHKKLNINMHHLQISITYNVIELDKNNTNFKQKVKKINLKPVLAERDRLNCCVSVSNSFDT